MLTALVKGRYSSSSSSSVLAEQTCQRFSLAEIQSATNNFEESLIIGSGGFGNVYKGHIEIGSAREVAIKRLGSKSSQGAHEFEAEVQLLSKLRHDNLVSLLGYCSEGEDMILVYEFMPNKTVEDQLRTPDSFLSSWLQRLKICVGAARGLAYLHTGTSTQQGVIHRDVKSSNILLDANFDAKISDFGLAKTIGLLDQTHVTTAVKGTFGYMDPSYFYTGKLTSKSDVYAFGVILFEMLSGNKAVDSTLGEDQCSLAAWAQHRIKQGRLHQIVDPRLITQISLKCLKEFASVAGQCLHTLPKQRHAMAEIVFKLDSILSKERKGTYSVVDEEGFVYKLRSLLTGNVQASIGSKSDMLCLLMKQKLEATGDNAVITLFSTKELRKATNNYSEGRIVGQGGYGVVYKGLLPDGRIVAIKRFKQVDLTQSEQFINEIFILAQINHLNVVRLLGCCLEEEVPVLVYEFIVNGTLFDHIHYDSNGMHLLSWMMRLRVAAEAASALAYLHSHTPMHIIHRDVKSANILFDDKYRAKISDFGASRLVPLDHNQVIQCRLGYLDPEYFITSQLTEKSDVYSFGVVLAELITSEKPFSSARTGEEKNLAIYFLNSMKENSLLQIVEPQVLREASLEQLEAVAELVKRCLNLAGENRPTMREVAMELEGLRKFIDHPWWTTRNI